MKKTLLLITLVLGIIMSMFTVPSFAESVDVEIKFAVGDNTLIINGNPVTVVTPYVVGEGVTLVPVRVITEAFGAQVGWVDETQTVTLSYPDVNIILQIGNPIAEVNGKATELLAPPELTNSSTMVPLRFISENFGAVVSYDEATEKITVTKTKSSESSGIVEGGVLNSKIGDSYYGWSMNNPVDMTMEERSFDGTYTSFKYDDDTWIDIEIYCPGDEYDFKENYENIRDVFSSYTLVKQDKEETSTMDKMHFQAKTKTSFKEYYEIKTDKYLYKIYVTVDVKDTQKIAEMSEIAASFEPSFVAEDVYDLSNIKNNMRKFKEEELKISFDVPADFIYSENDTVNDLRFYHISSEDNVSMMNLKVYSKENGVSAKWEAQKERDRSQKIFNEMIVSVGKEITTTQYNGIEFYHYPLTVKSQKYTEYGRDIYFELGEYIYTMYIGRKGPCENFDDIVTSIMQSIKAEKLNPSETGQFIKDIDERTDVREINEFKNCSITIPVVYKEINKSSENLMYINSNTSVTFSALYLDSCLTLQHTQKYIDSFIDEMENDADVKIQKYRDNIEISGKKYYKTIAVVENEGSIMYVEIYTTSHNGKGYMFIGLYPELAYSQSAKAEIMKILTSIRLK